MHYAQYLDDFKCRTTLVTRVYNSALTKKKELKTKRPILLRASSLPTCSLLLLEKMLLDDFDQDEAMMDYYCSVGTTIHTFVQKWLEDCGSLYGDWICPKCRTKHSHSIESNCSKCGSPMTYHEVSLAYNILSGHVDSIFRLKNGRYIVVDYKSTSSRMVQDKKFLPNAKHLIQVSVYAAILQKIHGLDVESVSILYIARDNPALTAEYNLEYTEDLHKNTMSFIKGQIKGFKAAERSKQDASLALAEKYKLCKSYDHYKSEVEKFISFDGCPLAKTCFSKSALKQHFLNLDLF